MDGATYETWGPLTQLIVCEMENLSVLPPLIHLEVGEPVAC